MMLREDFVFTIGYQGDTAVVDKSSRRRYGSLSALELLDHGLYKSAFCAALFSGDSDEMSRFIEAYRAKTGRSDVDEESLKRLYGVFANPANIRKVLLV